MGKTKNGLAARCSPWKHPHRRGEDPPRACAATRRVETPPQAWGRQSERLDNLEEQRNTPTGVGKTPRGAGGRGNQKKHPHRRGEDPGPVSPPQMTQETPPQAWGRPTGLMVMSAHSRNTPTGVGKTRSKNGMLCAPWKHPHRRGEDGMISADAAIKEETPPQAWGRRTSAYNGKVYWRNTPTGVGKTCSS